MKIAFSVVLFLLSLTATAQDIEIKNLKKHVYFLADDKMKGRGTGSKQTEKDAAYIRKEFKKLNLQALGNEGYYQPFKAKVRRVIVPDSLRDAKNVICFLDNGTEKTIVIGAHYDHLGEGKQESSRD